MTPISRRHEGNRESALQGAEAQAHQESFNICLSTAVYVVRQLSILVVLALVLIGCTSTNPPAVSPVQTYSCPTGEIVANISACPPPPVQTYSCPTGEIVKTLADCPQVPKQTYSCPTGEIVQNISECPPAAKTDTGAAEPQAPPEAGKLPCAGMTDECTDLTSTEQHLPECCTPFICVRPQYSLVGHCVEPPWQSNDSSGVSCHQVNQSCGYIYGSLDKVYDCCEGLACYQTRCMAKLDCNETDSISSRLSLKSMGNATGWISPRSSVHPFSYFGTFVDYFDMGKPCRYYCGEEGYVRNTCYEAP